MATRKHFAHNVADRARKIGWVVTPKDYGYEIKCPDQYKIQIHMTPSDRNHEQVVMRLLNNHGFSDAEKEFALLSEEDRKSKIRESAKKAQEELEIAQRNADLLARAAGQQRVSEDVILTPAPMPKTFERVLITPELASKILERNKNNRPLRLNEANHWKKLIKNGFWRYTHQGVAIDSNGILQDGQHRLTGIVLADVPCEMQISIGMPIENFQAIDTGLKRTFGDVVTNLGLKGGGRVGAAARTLIIYGDLPDRVVTSKVHNSEISQFVTRQFDESRIYGEVIHEATVAAQHHWIGYRINPTACAAGIFLLWKEVSENNPTVEDFLNGLRTGENLTKEDPRRLLMRYTLNPSRIRTSWHHLALWIKTWNNYAAGDYSRKHLTFRKDEEMPKLYIP